MGNQTTKAISNCCTNEYAQGKKEVDISKDKGIDDSSGNFFFRPSKSPHEDKYNLPLQMPNSHNYDSRDVSANVRREEDRVKYLEEIVYRVPRLVLRVINSTTLAKNTLIFINAQGVDGSLRGKKDGITYFGCKKKSKPLNENFESSEILNDYIIRNKDPETNDRHRGRHFQIEYSLDTNTYKIRDLGIGFGAFVKIDTPLLLKDNNLISMGSSFLIINLDDDTSKSIDSGKMLKMPQYLQGTSGEEIKVNKKYQEQKPVSNKTFSEIVVKIFGGPNYGEVFRFNSMTPVLRIGRMPDCEIRIDDNLLSKYQATIKWDMGTGWVLLDGHGNKPSTNSNWLYLNDDYEMQNGMIFKANHTLFQATIEPPEI